MSILSGVAFLSLAFGAGAYGVVIGAGGGSLLGPLLILLWKVPLAQAVGTTLTVVFLNSVMGALGYARQRQIDFRSGLILAIAALPGSVLGALGVKAVPGKAFLVALGSLLVLLAFFIVLFPSPFRNNRQTARRLSLPGSSLRHLVTAEESTYSYPVWDVGLGIMGGFFGFLSSFFGLGGGWFRTPILIYLFRFPVKVAIATSLFAQAIYTLVGVGTHGVQGNISPPFALLGGVGVITGSQLGIWAAQRLRAAWILRLLGLALVGVGASLLLEAAR